MKTLTTNVNNPEYLEVHCMYSSNILPHMANMRGYIFVVWVWLHASKCVMYVVFYAS